MDILNVYISIWAWLAYNFIIFQLEKDGYDAEHAKFPFATYCRETWDNWVGSGLMIPLLLWIGYRQLNIIDNPLLEHPTSIAWSDLYYLFSGVVTEVVIKRIKEWRRGRLQ